ncbi:MAG: biotin/lipoyl-binding protein [Rikenellaceae bacterium]|jgi:pyruvate carboxylase|nr:biotin/lipoyl-binding protein [Rikenellaceae bacterium]
MSDEKEIPYEIIETRHGRFLTTVNEMYRRRRKWEPATPEHLLSSIPGTVVSINVKPGDTVKVGQELMIFNAMKMNNRITSPLRGIVKTIHVKIGDHVPKGGLIIEFE